MLAVAPASGAVTDFTNWTLLQDPVDDGFTGSATSTDATLNALNMPVPDATDIGFASINANTALEATAGYVFETNASFTIAIDFDLTFSSALGVLSAGFGIGTDVAGMNSAGVVLGALNGVPTSNFAGGARVLDEPDSILDTGVGASLTGSLFVFFNATGGDVRIGASQTPGAPAPDSAPVTYEGIQTQWPQQDLLASFFIRSGPGVAWTSGTAEAIFSNFRVLEGAAVQIPAAPTPLMIAGVSALVATRRRRRA